LQKHKCKKILPNINLANVFNEIKNNLNDKNFTISDTENIVIKGRPSALRRAFENIIQNGLIYGEAVSINIKKNTNRAIIYFEDNGPGIPEDHYKDVFKPFFRLDKSRSLNKSGVGLGLAIVEDIINSHGGNIQLGKSKQNGLLVKISLPF